MVAIATPDKVYFAAPLAVVLVELREEEAAGTGKGGSKAAGSSYVVQPYSSDSARRLETSGWEQPLVTCGRRGSSEPSFNLLGPVDKLK